MKEIHQRVKGARDFTVTRHLSKFTSSSRLGTVMGSWNGTDTWRCFVVGVGNVEVFCGELEVFCGWCG